MVIDNEEMMESRRRSSQQKEENQQGSQAYLYKEEFKLILQLVFTLSQYDLKHSKLTAENDSSRVQQDGASQARQEDRALAQDVE